MATNTYKPVNKTDKPPTKADANMRKKHTADSVQYNLQHMQDHGQALTQSLDKLKTVSKPDAKKLAQDASKTVGMMHSQINQAAGMSGNMNMKGNAMTSGTTKKTGTTDGKSNKLGGGGRFQQMVNKGVSPALAGFIGRKKYGAKAMSKMSAASRAKNSK